MPSLRAAETLRDCIDSARSSLEHEAPDAFADEIGNLVAAGEIADAIVSEGLIEAMVGTDRGFTVGVDHDTLEAIARLCTHGQFRDNYVSDRDRVNAWLATLSL